jgi:ABC-type proline/glycine betaine transport system ATPase subunit
MSVLFIGESGSGKTAIANMYSRYLASSVGGPAATIISTTFQMDRPFGIVDPAYCGVPSPDFINHARVICVVFDVNNDMHEALAVANHLLLKGKNIIMVGNKTDLHKVSASIELKIAKRELFMVNTKDSSLVKLFDRLSKY